MDQIRGAKNHNFKGQFKLTQPVVAVPITDKPVLNAAPFKEEYTTVVKLECKEYKNPRFYEKEGFDRKPLFWSQQSPSESTLEKYGKLSTNTEDGTPPFKEDGGTIYVQHNGRRIIKRHRLSVTVGMKGIVYTYEPVTKYVSKLCLNF